LSVPGLNIVGKVCYRLKEEIQVRSFYIQLVNINCHLFMIMDARVISYQNVVD
jgi:hypothetical protein